MRDPKAAVQASLREVLENQVRAGDPPDAKETCDRLRSEGESPEHTWRLLEGVLPDELNAMVRERREPDRVRYAAHLHMLPSRR